jgi:hypothetical protein
MSGMRGIVPSLPKSIDTGESVAHKDRHLWLLMLPQLQNGLELL